jgi:subtilisin-like proprotein convertase family protein
VDYRFVVLLLLFSLNSALAADLKLDGSLVVSDGILDIAISVQNKVDRIVDFNLRYQLKRKEESWALLDTIDCGGNFSIAGLEAKEFPCTYSIQHPEDGEYKVFVKANIVNGTYTYKDLFFGVGQEFKEVEKTGDLVFEWVEAPETVKTGEEFEVVVNITSARTQELEIYSYVYEGKNCLSFYGWKGNAQKQGFKEGETKTVTLQDVVGRTESGNYSLKVRANGEKTYDLKRPIGVEFVESDLYKEIDPPVRADRGTNPELFFLIIPALIILFLALKRFL